METAGHLNCTPPHGVGRTFTLWITSWSRYRTFRIGICSDAGIGLVGGSTSSSQKLPFHFDLTNCLIDIQYNYITSLIHYLYHSWKHFIISRSHKVKPIVRWYKYNVARVIIKICYICIYIIISFYVHSLNWSSSIHPCLINRLYDLLPTMPLVHWLVLIPRWLEQK